MSLVQQWREALANPAAIEGARAALDLVKSWCDPDAVPRLPGCGTLDRLALRIHRGATVEEAAASEYRYRWSLALNQWVNFAQTDRPGCRHGSRNHAGAWPVPHLIGL